MPPRKRVPKNGTALKMVGAQVAVLRVRKGLTQRQLAKLVRMEEETIASIEQGRRALMPDVAETMDRVLESGGVLAAGVEKLPAVDQVPEWAEGFMDLEREALALSSYQNQVIPGLLQTEAYAHAVFTNEIPALSQKKIAERVAVRMARQEILHRQDPPNLSYVISEAALRDQLGGPDIHREALLHLRACTDLHGVTVQVMPLGRHTHAGLSGPFVLIVTPDLQHLAYAETQRGSQLISDPNEVNILSAKYAMLRSQALNPEETTGLLDGLLGER
ncbi:helix-turn-helix transcriptional regulator [Streptomyces sp. 2P-4]|uniref:helix-turn-helix domain-containing protein n=1 Tax=Streptomyces sp. 2P-4 TaxID=2931974 RepID=UPI00253F76D8|nr:helix-turn-helix transcriptional regulator [Streptomyces sp. 2P-4]